MPEIHYKEYGGGYPLVFLHGFCETNYVWSELADLLQRDFHVICPDMPGFGRSPLFADSFTIDDVAREIKIWLHKLSIQKCLVLGHSLGGYVALSLVKQYPEMVKGLCLFNSTAFADSEDKKENRNKLIEHIKANGVASFIKTFVPSLFYEQRVGEFEKEIDTIREQGLTTSPHAVMGYAAAMRDRPDAIEVLKTNAEKALIIAGEEDQNVPKNTSLELGRYIDKDNFHLLPSSAHMGMFEQKEMAASIIKDFADKILTPPEAK